MTDDERTEVTTTGIVRKRNENGYIIHPDRRDTGEADRRFGWTLIIAGVLTTAVYLPAGLGGVYWLVPWGVLGWIYLTAGCRKRRRVSGSRRNQRDRDRDGSRTSLLESDLIWRYRHYWALLGFGTVGATIIAGNGLVGKTVPVVTLVGIVALITLGWGRRRG